MRLGCKAGISCVERGGISYMLYTRLFAVFFAIAMTFTVFPQIALAQDYQFSTVEVQGNKRIEDVAILTYAGIERGKTVTAGQLNDAYQRIEDSGLFESVSIEPRGSKLVVTVVEFGGKFRHNEL